MCVEGVLCRKEGWLRSLEENEGRCGCDVGLVPRGQVRSSPSYCYEMP
jgi:hypothetical protein